MEHLAVICKFKSESENSTMVDGMNNTGNLQRYDLDRFFK